ncbi:MAG TPA: GLUG motif-containing protein [Candidatus Kryptonia bacterium]
MERCTNTFAAASLFVLICAANTFLPTARAQTAVHPSGSGTSSSDPYQIDSLANLVWIVQNSSSWGSYFLQTADIDASSDTSWNSGAGFTPIAYPGSGYSFTGHYDGGGHTTTGLFISQGSTGILGLFGSISNAEIKNLGLINVNITGADHIGGLIGYTSLSTIDDCYTTGIIHGNGGNVGGLVGGTGGGVLSNSHSTASVNASGNDVGGLVGDNYSSGSGFGGDYGTSSSIRNCYATGNVRGNSDYAGGLVGANEYYGQIEKCYSTGNVSGANDIGGLVGENLGVNSNVTSFIDSSYSTGSVDGSSQAGGLVGQNLQSAKITNSHSSGNVVCTGNYSGGFVGSNSNFGSISNCYCTCIDSGADYAGGITGQNGFDGTISECYSTGSVVGRNYVGGLVGYNVSDDGASSASNSYSSDSVVATGSYVGGLVGDNYLAGIIKCYSRGSVVGSSDVGGLAGLSLDGAISNSFWDTQTSGQPSNGNGTGENTSAMKTQSTFTNGGWDFTNVWAADSNINNGYPGLLWQSQYVPAAPAATTDTSTSVSWGSATLNGAVSSHKGTTTVKFIYGTVSGNYPDTVTASQSPVNGWGGASVSASISPLASSQTYYYRVIASNSYGPAQGNELNFTTTSFIAVQPSGSGTSNDPFQIDSLQNLYWITQNSSAWDTCFVQTANIDASSTIYWNSGAGFSPIGNGGTYFTGTYNGKGHTITGLFISSGGASEVGMFGDLVNGRVKNLALINEHVAGGSEVGGLVGYSVQSSIDSCSTSGNVIGASGGYVGGLVGFDDSSIVSNSYSTDSVNDASNSDVGGLVGISQFGSSITNSYAVGNVVGNIGVGGLVGYNINRSTISNCHSSGSVTVSLEDAGGLVGYNYSSCAVSNCYSTGSVSGSQYEAGGLIGYNYSNCPISDCYSTGSVSGSWYVGGLVGYNYNSSVTNCYSTGSVSGSTNVGGLLGFNSASSVNSCFWDIQTSGHLSSPAGTGDSTDEMKTESTFTNSGWDFVSTWGINGVTNNGYPYLLPPPDHSLPVQATDFLATADVGSITLKWKTQSEVDNAGFNIMREDPGTSAFKLIASYASNNSLKGLGTSSTGRTYNFTDNRVVSGSTYQYKIQSVSTSGMTKDLTTLTVTVDVPKTYALYQNYPNPFNPSTTIRFDLKQQSTVTLDIYNVLGQRVLGDNFGTLNAGRYNQNINLGSYASGVYFYRIDAVGNDGKRFESIKKLVLMK